MPLPQLDLLVATVAPPLLVHRSDGADLKFVPHPSALFVGMLDSAARNGGVTWICQAGTTSEQDAAVLTAGQRWSRSGLAASVRHHSLDVIMLPGRTRATDSRSTEFVRTVLSPIAHHTYDPDDADISATARLSAWVEYAALNTDFAVAIAEHAPVGASVFVMGLDLLLVAGRLRATRSDLTVAVFIDSPWPSHEFFSALPVEESGALIDALQCADRLVFQTEEWRAAYRKCTRMADRADTADRTSVNPIAIDLAEISAKVSLPPVEAQLANLSAAAGDTAIIGRADRADVSNNLLRGMTAFRDLLRRHPEWIGKVTHVATLFPGGDDPRYAHRASAAARMSDAINAEFGDGTWRPSRFSSIVDYPLSIALMCLSAVWLDNSIANGMSVPVLEAAVLSRTAAPLVLSGSTGAAQRLRGDVVEVPALDVGATAEGLHRALSLDGAARRLSSERIRLQLERDTPAAWFDRLVADFVSLRRSFRISLSHRL